jgi:hypothetical protein
MLGQGNYEVQVYGSDITPPGRTMVEFHSNFTFNGVKLLENGVLPTHHAFHETLEVTQGWNKWFETGFYVFTSYNANFGWQFVGSHIRPRIAVPEEFHWPVGLALSVEAGYQRPNFSADTWTVEIRPIVDKTLGKAYLSFNPTMARSFHGPGTRDGLVFQPNAKASVKLTKRVAGGLEYYGSLGSLRGFDPIRDQAHLILPCLDVDFGEDWEFNVGLGVGVTQATDHMILKLILGRRFNFGHRR